jgi:hypothetical protein
MYKNKQGTELLEHYTSDDALCEDYYRKLVYPVRFCTSEWEANKLRDEALRICKYITTNGEFTGVYNTTVKPMLDVYLRYRDNKVSATAAYAELAQRMEPDDSDWKLAAMNWFKRRMLK